MHFYHSLSLFTCLATLARSSPLLDRFSGFKAFNFLEERTSCSNPCGWDDQLCCSSSEYCYTDSADEAVCATSTTAAATTAGYWTTWTTEYTETDTLTITSLISSYITTAATTTATTTAVSCDYSLDEVACGSICCDSGYICVTSGECEYSGSGSSGVSTSWVATATTTSFSAPVRPTTDTTLTTVTATAGSATTTGTFVPPVATGSNSTITSDSSSSGNNLSGGAIAGIVIGVLIAVAILLLLCICCCLKGIFDGILAVFGFGRDRRERREKEEIVEERYRHHSSRRGSRRDDYSDYSERPVRVERRSERKTSGGIGKEALGIGAGLAGLAAVLGMKRARDNRDKERAQSRRREVVVKREDKYTNNRSVVSSNVTGTTESSESTYIRPPERVVRETRTTRSVSRRR